MTNAPDTIAHPAALFDLAVTVQEVARASLSLIHRATLADLCRQSAERYFDGDVERAHDFMAAVFDNPRARLTVFEDVETAAPLGRELSQRQAIMRAHAGFVQRHRLEAARKQGLGRVTS